jgi:mRNA interferase MazF
VNSRFTSVNCAPVYSVHDDLATQVAVGPDEGLKHDSSIHCDELVSLPKSALTNFIGALPPAKLQALNQALLVALDIF